jgi:mitochondrial fission protein ELM1
MARKTHLPIASCWIATEGLAGLRHQAIGLAQALGVDYTLKEVKKLRGLRRLLPPDLQGFAPPWPDLLITCGRQSVAASLFVRRASQGKTFTVHLENPVRDPSHFDLIIAPEHDRLRGENILLTRGAVNHVTTQKLAQAAEQFGRLLAHLPRPLITVLVGGKNKHQHFTESALRDFTRKLLRAARTSGGGLAVSFSRRTGAANELALRKALATAPSYIWDNQKENPYFGMLALAQVLVVTNDSVAMVSEACSTGKPVYIYELPNAGKRHRHFIQSLYDAGLARRFSGTIETWKNTPLEETRKAADFVRERFLARQAGRMRPEP